jgi:hypothetical protein
MAPSLRPIAILLLCVLGCDDDQTVAERVAPNGAAGTAGVDLPTDGKPSSGSATGAVGGSSHGHTGGSATDGAATGGTTSGGTPESGGPTSEAEDGTDTSAAGASDATESAGGSIATGGSSGAQATGGSASGGASGGTSNLDAAGAAGSADCSIYQADLSCTTDDDCCIINNQCIDELFVVTRANSDALHACLVPVPVTPKQCYRCGDPPTVQLGCEQGQCVAEAMSNLPSSASQPHCGRIEPLTTGGTSSRGTGGEPSEGESTGGGTALEFGCGT